MVEFFSSGWPLAAIRFILLAAGSIVLSELAARLGAGFVRRGGRTGPDALQLFGLGLLFGWGLIGLAYYGLSLVGLFHRPLIILLPVVLQLASPSFRLRRILVVEAGRAWAAVGWGGTLAILAALFPLVPHLLVPESAQDSYSYHLGAPWQFLVAHRALITNVFMDFHLPLPVEMAFALPLSLGFERLARWIVLANFLAAGAVWAGWCLKMGRKTAAWLGILLPLSLVHLSWNLSMSKNDGVAASLVVAGAVMLWQGRRFTAAALFGMGLSAKVVYGPVVALLLLAGPRPFSSPMRTGILLVLPILGWWIKTYIATNNPFFPLATGIIPTLDWDVRNNLTYSAYVTPLEAGDTRAWRDMPGAIISHLGKDSLLIPLLFPILILFPGSRRVSLALLASGVILLRAGHFTRFLVPVSWLLVSLIAVELSRLAGRWRGWMAATLAVLAVSCAFNNPLLRPAPWLEAKSCFKSALEGRLLTFGDAVHALDELKPRRVLTLGELASYRIPSRVVFTGMLGNTPLVWKSVKESLNERELARRFRQLGDPLILHNIVGMVWKGYRYQSFEWDRRMLTLYYGFSRRRLDLVREPERFDVGRGIFYIYRFQPVPRDRSYHPVARHFLPGVSTILSDINMLRNANRTEEALAKGRQMLEILPGLGVIKSEMAFVLNMAGRHAESYKILKPMMATGVVDSKNLIAFASAATEVGDYGSADRAFEWAQDHFPTIQPHLGVDRAEVWWKKARAEFREGELARAASSGNRAAEFLHGVPLTAIPEVEKSRRNSLAEIEGLRGDIAMKTGQRDEGLRCYRVALSFGAESPDAARWRRLLDSQ